MSKKLAVAMFGQKRLSREGGVEIVVKELCTRMAQNRNFNKLQIKICCCFNSLKMIALEGM